MTRFTLVLVVLFTAGVSHAQTTRLYYQGEARVEGNGQIFFGPSGFVLLSSDGGETYDVLAAAYDLDFGKGLTRAEPQGREQPAGSSIYPGLGLLFLDGEWWQHELRVIRSLGTGDVVSFETRLESVASDRIMLMETLSPQLVPEPSGTASFGAILSSLVLSRMVFPRGHHWN